MAGGSGARRRRRRRRPVQGPTKGCSGRRKAEAEIDCSEGQKYRLPDAEVQWIISRERREFSPDLSDVPEDKVQALKRAHEAFNNLEDRFAEYQAEVRAEYETKGYVEVDEEFFEEREARREWMRKKLADMYDKLDLSGMTFGYAHGEPWHDSDEEDKDEEDGEEEEVRAEGDGTKDAEEGAAEPKSNKS